MEAEKQLIEFYGQVLQDCDNILTECEEEGKNPHQDIVDIMLECGERIRLINNFLNQCET